MACSLQKLFAVEEEFEDEDFLSAVEDAENRFTGSLPVNAGRLRPVSSRPQETVQAQSSRLLLLHPTAPSEALGLPDLDLCLPASSTPSADSRPSCIGAAPLRPVSTSSSWIGNQRRVTVTEVLRETARPQSSALHPLLTFESQQQQVGGFEGPEQDEFDKVLASMELEEPGMELECGVSSEAIPILPAQQREGSVLAKKARVVDLSGSCQKGPVPAIHKAGIMSAQDESLDPVIQCRTPRPPLRPGAVGHLPVPTALTVPTQQLHWEVCPQRSPVQALQPLQAARGTIQSSPQNRFPCQPFQSPSSWLSGKAHLPRPRTPNSSCSTPSRTSSGLFPRIPLQPQAPVSSIGSPVGTPKGPQGALQTPIVTNHLVQLVTAASRTPQQPTHPSTRAKTRRFPGPAGILPHQIVASSQASVEEDFGRGPWLTMKSTLGLDERDPSCFLCTYSIVMVLRKAALKQLPRNKVPNMAVMIKSLTRSTMDASVVFKDPTGEMQGTVHRLLLETCQNELKPGSVLLLKQIGVFSPSLRNHYLNVTPNNLVHIYSPDSGDGSFLKPSQPFPKDSGSFQHDVAAKPEEGFRTAQNLEAEASPEEELPEADDLDGLLSELPEDFFCGTSS
ncbi:homologous recombination OB-fold protein isoform X3 [Homo sapiens]|uniref:homologous recombination OB-fold protein isoform X3 n=1 Tax=Homo sapiens TaxID=9606 RepID=UPI000020136A|nr:homologous recombination OB-fold protein isoform X3 [Homo sapiens]XP_054173068.1 homologous recombination OB-fold protein isoform X3 [Homo sapiens]